VTADLHLRTRWDHPERYNALENIFEQIEAEGIDTLIIAGDLFDKDFCTYVEFENVCRAHPSVQVHIIPGNHDPAICGMNVVGDTIRVHGEPVVLELDTTLVVFLPYEPQATMAQRVAETEPQIADRTWILVGHGDYYRGARRVNPLEPGTYMPLSGACVDRYRPRAVFLGHIHKPLDLGPVHYPGSPCGLDISEAGRRRFLIYDTGDGSIVPRMVETDVLYFQETFIVVPADDEVLRIGRQIAERIESWPIEPSDIPKIRVRAEAKGYARDRAAILEALKRGFEGFQFHDDEGPSIDELRWSSDRQMMATATRALSLIDELDYPFGGDEPAREQVVLQALSVIFGM
jgi:DNA repair exonuclease SbcCD nuclease subunit